MSDFDTKETSNNQSIESINDESIELSNDQSILGTAWRYTFGRAGNGLQTLKFTQYQNGEAFSFSFKSAIDFFSYFSKARKNGHVRYSLKSKINYGSDDSSESYVLNVGRRGVANVQMGDSNDLVIATNAYTILNANLGGGNDLAIGGAGNDTIKGGTGNDLINGLAGNDKLYGDAGNDTIYGGDGNDTIYGGTGDDVINGGLGNDNIFAGKGNNILFGGGGKDNFYFENSYFTKGVTYHNTIKDFGRNDKINFLNFDPDNVKIKNTDGLATVIAKLGTGIIEIKIEGMSFDEFNKNSGKYLAYTL